VPVVGSIIAEASETVLAGAGLLRSTIGIFGTLSVLAICAYPFLQLGIQYLLYKLTAFLALTVGPPGLSGLINGLGSAFGLVLGMTGACALLLLVSVLSSVAAVIP
jgi:stage III sporulation protein AE